MSLYQISVWLSISHTVSISVFFPPIAPSSLDILGLGSNIIYTLALGLLKAKSIKDCFHIQTSVLLTWTKKLTNI